MNASTLPSTPERPLSATRLAQYATARGRCERYLRLALFPSEGEALMQRYGVIPEALSPLLAEAGSVFAHEAVAKLASQASVTDLHNRSAQACIDALREQPVGRALYYQAKLTGHIGARACEGIADVIDVVRRADQALGITVLDIKAGRRNSVSFCLQIAFYARLLKDALARAEVPVASVRGAIVAREGTLAATTPEPLDLALFEDEIERLIAMPDAEVMRVLQRPFAVADYHLSAKCDGCPYNAVCFIDSAERQDLSLIPLLTATEKRALQRQGLTHVRQVATLMHYGQRDMVPAPGRASDMARLSQHWPLGGRLPVLVQRCRALHYLEQQFTHRNRTIEKAPLDLTRLDQVAVEPEQVSLHRCLEDFLLLEHHARHQAAMLYLAQPPELRAQTGNTAVVRCERYERGDGADYGVCVLSDVHGTPLRPEESADLRLQEGTWVVLSSLCNDEGRPHTAGELVRGRLGVIGAISDAQLNVRLHRMSFKSSPFRYTHRCTDLQPGQVYTLDEMVDDLNVDKYLDACRHATSNHLYRWLSEAYRDPQAPKPLRMMRPSRLRAGLEFAALAASDAVLAAQSQPAYGLTPAQRTIVGAHYSDCVLVVQGPPGTGQSHTLGLAILARAWALKSAAQPFRVAIAAKTHAAVSIVLHSVVRRLHELLARHGDETQLDLFRHLRLAKVCNDVSEPVPAEVEVLLAEGNDEQSASAQWQELLAEPLLIVGGTPGGLYRLMKQGAARGRQLDWSEVYFDLVVVDEASQMSLAEALTAAAFLRQDGQFIAVGDHRQMPPILQHAWDQANRRDLARARPHLSIFAYLIALDFARGAG
jgi:hypothetical protein